jgi:hypothetical protein
MMTSPNGTQPRPINGYPSVSAAAKAARMTRQDYKRAMQEAKRRKRDQRRLQREMAAWEQMEQA